MCTRRLLLPKQLYHTFYCFPVLVLCSSKLDKVVMAENLSASVSPGSTPNLLSGGSLSAAVVATVAGGKMVC